MTSTGVLRNARYLTFLGAHVVGSLGRSMMLLGAGIWVQKLTGSNAGAALTILFALAPTLFSPLAGAVIDRVSRRSALVYLNLASALCIIPLLLVHSASQVPLIYLVLFANGMIAMAIQPAQSAQLVELSTPEELPAMNGLLRAFLESLKLGSPALGAGLFVLAGPHAVIVVHLACSLVAAVLIGLLPRSSSTRHAATQNASGSFRRTFLDGFKLIYRDGALRRLTLVGCLFMTAAGVSESLRWAVVSDGLDVGAEWMGALQMLMGVGSITFGILSMRLVARLGSLKATGLALVLFAAGVACWGTGSVAIIAVGALLVGGGVTMIVISALVLLQSRAAPDQQGKVFSAFELLTTGPQLVSIGIGAYLIATVDYQLLAFGLAACSIALAIVVIRPTTVGKRTGGQ